jgi:cyclic pyranopterin phosphate synthase
MRHTLFNFQLFKSKKYRLNNIKRKFSKLEKENVVDNDKKKILTDSFGRFHNYLRISVTERCNLRCTYCMPEEGVQLTPNEKLLTTDELVRIVKVFSECGVSKIRFTGGEPTIRKDIIELTQKVGALPGIKNIAITSNGIVLARKLPQLVEAGLKLVNISLDTLVEDKFTKVARRAGFKAVMNSINKALELKLHPIKLNCVLMRGINDDEILDFVKWTKTHPLEIRFIEYMPFDGNIWSDKKFMSYKDVIEIIKKSGYPLERDPDEPNHTSKTYQVPGHLGKIGFITSMSEHFCGTCNRLRLMADGSLKICLFGRKEYSLRDKIREGATDEQLKEYIHSAIQQKKASHDGMHELEKKKGLNRPMILIGG